MNTRKSKFDTPEKTSIRFSEEDIVLFEMAAEAEGADSVVQWLLTAGRKRARLLKHGVPTKLTETIIPPPG